MSRIGRFNSTTLRRLIADESGATGVEYAVLAAMMAGVLYPVVGFAGMKVEHPFQQVSQALSVQDVASPSFSSTTN